MKNKHPKRIMALKMQTKVERKTKGMAGSPFDSQAWRERSEIIRKRITKKTKI